MPNMNTWLTFTPALYASAQQRVPLNVQYTVDDPFFREIRIKGAFVTLPSRRSGIGPHIIDMLPHLDPEMVEALRHEIQDLYTAKEGSHAASSAES